MAFQRTLLVADRRESPVDWFFNRTVVKAPGLVFLALYGAWLLWAGIRGALTEGREQT